MDDIEAIIELLECAKINVDNIKKAGVGLIPLVKKQINDAIKLIDPEWPIDEE